MEELKNIQDYKIELFDVYCNHFERFEPNRNEFRQEFYTMLRFSTKYYPKWFYDYLKSNDFDV